MYVLHYFISPSPFPLKSAVVFFVFVAPRSRGCATQQLRPVCCVAMVTQCPLSDHHVLGPVWNQLSVALRATLHRQGIVTASLLRGCLDGTIEDASEMCQEMGGSPADAGHLCELWVLSEPTAAI